MHLSVYLKHLLLLIKEKKKEESYKGGRFGCRSQGRERLSDVIRFMFFFFAVCGVQIYPRNG